MNDVVSLPTVHSPPNAPGSRPTVSPWVFESVVFNSLWQLIRITWEAFNKYCCLCSPESNLIKTDSPGVGPRLWVFCFFFLSPRITLRCSQSWEQLTGVKQVSRNSVPESSSVPDFPGNLFPLSITHASPTQAAKSSSIAASSFTFSNPWAQRASPSTLPCPLPPQLPCIIIL